MNRALKKAGYTVLVAAIAIFAVFVYLGYAASQKFELQSWHQSPDHPDQLTRQPFADFASYRAAEQALIDSIYAAVQVEAGATFNKYDRSNPSSPYRNGRNFNGSFEFVPKDGEIRGGILLVHGLTDSPYHMRAVGKLFAANGFYVIGLRLPGHGTVPGALLDVHWKDWYQAVKFSADKLLAKIGAVENRKFYLGGFSTGGALTLRYVLESVSDPQLETPDKLLLLSPAIGINRLAEVMDWHKLTSWMFEEFKWLEIKPEYDPYKYNSFAKNAADQIFDLTIANQKLIKNLAKTEGALEKLPPIYAYQSCVDATVKTGKLLEMFAKIAPAESELLLFDVNRTYEAAMPTGLALNRIIDYETVQQSKARIIMVTNRPKNGEAGYQRAIRFQALTVAAEARARQMEADSALAGLQWPKNIFALSHVCIPISPEDSIYGSSSELGAINAKGENEVLIMGGDLQRLRYNPFFDLISASIREGFWAQ